MAKTRHATDHQNGGTDEIDVTGLTGAGAAAHATSHQNGGADEISIAGLDGTPVELTNHLNDATDAHDASAISFTPTGTIAATDVQAAIAEVASEAAGGHAEDHDHDGAPTQKLAQANTHESPDTDAGPTSLHHTLGTGANQAAAGTHGHAPNLWKMAKGAGLGNQTLTNNTADLITWDTAEIDGGGSVIDLANEQFVAPATGFYIVYMFWRWTGTVPLQGHSLDLRVGGASVQIFRGMPITGSIGANATLMASVPVALTSGDLVTMYINPGAVTGVTANGNAATNARCWFALQRVT